ncbi:MAG: PD-(D/E)XK nuclease family protein [Endomicrobium sp.]|jgi:putative RecB family exonuclease|nr:PD-(D/E)XK nuclease family protein [Endomicrobium sp.]
MRQDFKISYSRINTYLFCPYKYKLIYFDGVHVPINADITFGHIIHKTLEQFHSGKKQVYDVLFEYYDDVWKNDGFNDPHQIFEYYKRGKVMLTNYYASFINSNSKVLYVEKAFNTNIGKYKFVGIIDRIDIFDNSKHEIIDYKTHLKVWNQKMVDQDLQLSFYTYACKNVFGLNINKISIYFLSENKKIYTKRSRNEIINAMNIATKIAKDIESEKFLPDTSKCKMCSLKLKCKCSL